MAAAHVVLLGASGISWQGGGLRQTTDALTWGLDRIDQRASRLDRAYRYGQTGAGVSVYIIDTGVRAAHEDFGGRVISAGDFCAMDAAGNPASEDSSDRDSGKGHGTINASLAAGKRSGSAKAATVVALRAMCAGGLANAVTWVTAHGRRPGVVNISACCSEAVSPGLRNAVLAGVSAGFSFTLSAGCSSEGVDATWGPEVAAATLVTASSNARDEASGRPYGSSLALFAPAVRVGGALKGSNRAFGDYGQVSENCADSHSAPYVAGIVARYLERHPAATPAEVRRVLVAEATPDALSGVRAGTPNRLAYSGFLD
jgi:subtilisin family serine protease